MPSKAGLRPALLLLAFCLAGCKSHKNPYTEEAPIRMASMLTMADPRAATQLVDGWYRVEAGSWRWTAGHFAALLRPPAGSAQNGAVLKLKLNVPQAVLDHIKSTTLTAAIAGTKLAPETYSQAGDYIYARPVPAQLLTGESVKVEFTLDKFLTAGLVEIRELGIIVTAVGLEPPEAGK